MKEIMLKTIDKVLDDMFSIEHVRKITEASSGTPIAASSAISSKDRAELADLYERLRKAIDTHKFNIDFQQDRIYITKIMDSQLGWDYTPYQRTIPEGVETSFDYETQLAEICKYMIEQGAAIEPLPEIELKEDPEEANNFFGKTAYYSPGEKKVVLYTLGRHPKDVCRSFTHEMIHHIQNLEGRIGDGRITTTNVHEDEYLQQIENEAYSLGNKYFRRYTDSKKKDGERGSRDIK